MSNTKTTPKSKNRPCGPQPLKGHVRAYRMRIYPTPGQAGWIHRMFGQARFVFNEALALWKETRESTGRGLSYGICAARLPGLKKSPDTCWLAEGDSIALQSSLRNLADAWSRYYAKQNREPRFKSKRNPVQSYTTRHVNGNIAVGVCWIELPKVGRIRTAVSRPLKGRIVSVTVKRHGSGRHYVSVLCEDPSLPAGGPVFLLPPTGRTVAIDLGIKSYATMFDSDRHVSVISNPRHFGRLEERLAIEQRKLARKQKRDANGHESNGRRRQAHKVARVHERIGDARNDALHKLSTYLVKTHDVIIIEDLDVAGMIADSPQSGCAKAVADAGWSEFCRLLEYKCRWYGRTLVVVDRYFPSSQLCGTCGTVNKDVKDVSVRRWTCPVCGAVHDRDVNAAQNLLREGTRILTAREAV